ncbi:hypothetical protein [Defluviimonas sp. SAOS-178_SWC]|uniref:hypothetical protein n=1 Tax=Defluviimonas sp. SAOS-178_SWC TaxID=3121287 RepID=UPI003221CE5B
MRQSHTPVPHTVHAVHAPAARLTLPAALPVAMGLASAFLAVLAGVSFAMTMIRPG